jgi:hypothetical protein
VERHEQRISLSNAKKPTFRQIYDEFVRLENVQSDMTNFADKNIERKK